MGTLPRHREIKLPLEIEPEQVKASFGAAYWRCACPSWWW